MKKKELLAIYGGTFSPPQYGHKRAAETLSAALHPDRLLIIPTFLPPHKVVSAALAPEHRLEMSRLCFADLPNAEISDMEIKRAGKSYTFDTISALSKEDREIYFLCGTDMLLSFDSWYRYRDIFSLCTLVLERRESDRTLDTAVEEKIALFRRECGARILEIPIDPITLSSTDVRNAVGAGADREALTEMVPPAVADYILAHGLYRESGNGAKA